MLASRKWRGLGALLLALSAPAGCMHLDQTTAPSSAALAASPPAEEKLAKLTPAQIADLRIAYARTLEKSGNVEQALSSYLEALKNDPGRADACARLGIVYDQQGKCEEGCAWHRKAVAAQPKNPDYQNNLGYNLYLQSILPEAEMCFRECLTLAPEHSRAHNNLGMVLARTGHDDEALAEFRRAGCSDTDAQANLAYAWTLEHRWAEARASYQRLLAADPSSTTNRKALQAVDQLMAKAGPVQTSAPNP